MASSRRRPARIRLSLLTPRLALRLPRLPDVPRLLRYGNDPLVFGSLDTRHAHYKRSQVLEWAKRSGEAWTKGKTFDLVITVREQGTFAGYVGLEVRDRDNGHGRIGYWLARPYWHQGYGSEAVSAVCEVAFTRLQLHRIDAEVFDFNARSMTLLRRLGFKREGRTREILHRNGRWHDGVAFGLLAKDFRPIPPSD
ncbi:MAG: GNAT family protein [Thermoplasmata archaeon]